MTEQREVFNISGLTNERIAAYFKLPYTIGETNSGNETRLGGAQCPQKTLLRADRVFSGRTLTERGWNERPMNGGCERPVSAPIVDIVVGEKSRLQDDRGPWWEVRRAHPNRFLACKARQT